MKRCLVLLTVFTLGSGAGLAQASLARLEQVLSDWRLGCWGCGTRFNWSGEQWAAFTAGRLCSLGFAAKLASSGGEWWVVVTLTDPEPRVIPVLPGLPPTDKAGQYAQGVYLGQVARLPSGAFDPKYLSPTTLNELPPNIPPSVKVHWTPPQVEPGQEVLFFAEVADPDGQVVSVTWDFGEGMTSSLWSAPFVFPESGTFEVSVTVVDNLGAAVTARVKVSVERFAPPPSGGGCGCQR